MEVKVADGEKWEGITAEVVEQYTNQPHPL